MLNHERLRAKYLRTVRAESYRTLKRYTDDMLKRAESAQTIGDVQAQASREIDTTGIELLLTKIYKRVGADFAKLTIKDLNSQKAQRIEIDYWEDYFVRYSRTKLGQKISWIAGTTKQVMIDVVSRLGTIAGTEGWSIATYRNKLQEEFAFMNRYRAERIARTEIMVASNVGTLEGGRNAGIPVKKRWDPIVDQWSRPDHAAMAGVEPIGIDEMFNVGGVMMQQPGDGAGGAEHVINCRCGLTIVPDTTYEEILNR